MMELGLALSTHPLPPCDRAEYDWIPRLGFWSSSLPVDALAHVWGEAYEFHIELCL